MNDLNWLTIVLSVMNAIILPAIFFVWRHVTEIRRNDLTHIEDRLDRIEKKIDAHIIFHAERRIQD